MLTVGLLLASLAGCTSDDEGETSAQPRDEGAPAATARTSGSAPAQRRRPVRLLRLGNFDQPTYLAAPRGDSAPLRGRARGTDRDRARPADARQPFLDISDRVTTGGEGGLLSMAFARDYESSRRFYVYYTDNEGYLQIDSFRRSDGNPNRADPGSRRSVIRVPHHRFNHKGGQLQFGPDGTLYAGFGDGGGGRRPRRERAEPRPACSAS